MSLVNATATAARLRRLAPSRIVLVVTGDDGEADEDAACGELVMAIVRNEHVNVDRFRTRVERSPAADQLRAGLAAGFRGIHADDIRLALEVDRFAGVLTAIPSTSRVDILHSPAGQ